LGGAVLVVDPGRIRRAEYATEQPFMTSPGLRMLASAEAKSFLMLVVPVSAAISIIRWIVSVTGMRSIWQSVQNGQFLC
jgi:hypothetical protein